MSIDEAIDRLIVALKTGGARKPSKPQDTSIIGRIEEAVAPLGLPKELRTLWTRVDPSTIAIAPYPRPADPAFALESWQEQEAEFPGMVPRLLFPICYESHGFLLVELASDGGAPGTVFEWGYGGSPFRRRFDSVSDWVSELGRLIGEGGYEKHDRGGRSWYVADDEAWQRQLGSYTAEHAPHLLYGEETDIDDDVTAWPIHWLRASGFERPGLTGDDLALQLAREEDERSWQKTWVGVLKVAPVPGDPPHAAVLVTPSRPVIPPYVITVHGVDGAPWTPDALNESGEVLFRGNAGSGGFGLVVAYVRTAPIVEGPPVVGESPRAMSGLTIVDGRIHCDFIERHDLSWLARWVEPRCDEVPGVLAGRRPHYARDEPLPEEEAWLQTLAATGSIVEALREASFASRYGASMLASIHLAFVPPVPPPPPPTEPIPLEIPMPLERPSPWPPNVIGCRFRGEYAAPGYEDWLAQQLIV